MSSPNFTNPMLSIIIPVYNVAATIERCLDSLLNQSFKSIQIICVDDCSSDGSSEILRRYESKYPDIITYTQTGKRSGPGGARNFGMSLSRGQYISFIDGDDWVDSSLYSVVIESMCTNDADIAIFGIKDEYGFSASSKVRYEYPYFNSVDNAFALHLLTRAYDNNTFFSPMVCQKIYKRSFLYEHQLSFLANSYYEDDLFSFCCFLYESNIITVPGVYYHYYQRSDSVTHTFSKKHVDDLVQLTSNLKEALIKNDLWSAKRTDYFAYCSKCIRSTIETLFRVEPDIKSQKRYLSYLLTQLQSRIAIDEWFDYMDIHTIRRLFGQNI